MRFDGPPQDLWPELTHHDDRMTFSVRTQRFLVEQSKIFRLKYHIYFAISISIVHGTLVFLCLSVCASRLTFGADAEGAVNNRLASPSQEILLNGYTVWSITNFLFYFISRSGERALQLVKADSHQRRAMRRRAMRRRAMTHRVEKFGDELLENSTFCSHLKCRTMKPSHKN
jgi:hypothetical protein